MAKFEMTSGWADDLGRMAVDGFNRQMQPALDSLLRTHKGRPVDEVKTELAKVWNKNGGDKLSASDLTEYATLISNGTRIVLQYAAGR